LTGTSLEILEVGAAPVVRHFLDRLQLEPLLARYLPPARRRPKTSPPLSPLRPRHQLLLARRPLYGLPEWAARRVSEHLGLQSGQAALLGDDRFGRGSIASTAPTAPRCFTALVVRAVREFQVELRQTHNDTTPVTFAGAYRNSSLRASRPRPSYHIRLQQGSPTRSEQLLFSITVSADGAVPVHCKTYDGNVTDDHVHIETWDCLRELVGHGRLPVCGRLQALHARQPGPHSRSSGQISDGAARTRAEDAWFRGYLQEHAPAWRESAAS